MFEVQVIGIDSSLLISSRHSMLRDAMVERAELERITKRNNCQVVIWSTVHQDYVEPAFKAGAL